jgi:hypothetical protein
MKTSFLFLLLISIFTIESCNNLFKSNEPIVMKYTTHKEAIDTLRKQYFVANNLPDTVTEETPKHLEGRHISYALLNQDSSRLLLSKINFRNLLDSYDGDRGQGMYNGFFGTDHYRIEFVLSNVRSDSANPNNISVNGKTRLKKNIQKLVGNIRIDSVYEFRDSVVMQYMKEYAKGEVRSYYLKGKFQLAEDSTKWGSGLYKGDFFMDIQINNNDAEKESYWYYSYAEEGDYEGDDDTSHAKDPFKYGSESRSKTRGAGFLFDGNWTSYKTKESKPVLMAHDIFMFGNDILEHFSYGEREIEIDPKYKAIGWGNYWENDEWYNDENAKVMIITW